jgi:uncharacterized protein (TIGR03083 family)
VTATVSQYTEALQREAELLASAATGSGRALVPSCPGWTVDDVVRHTGGVHRWACQHIVEPPVEILDLDDPRDTAAGRTGDGLVAWFREGAALLAVALDAAPADLPGPVFLPAAGPARDFWARRQAHETFVHRVDVELAVGLPVSQPDPAIAADGIDELLTGFASRRKANRSEARGRIAFVTTDTGNRWLLTLTDDGPHGARSQDPGDVTVTASATDLSLYLWHREMATSAPPTIDGDAALLETWLGGVRVNW